MTGSGGRMTICTLERSERGRMVPEMVQTLHQSEVSRDKREPTLAAFQAGAGG